MDPLPPRLHRDVVSFVRRSARMNESQARSWERHRDTYVVDLPRGPMSTSIADDATVDWAAEFGREAPLIVEIGSGTGDSLAPMAAGRPEADVVAFEVFEPAIASTVGRLARAGVRNVRIVIADGAQGLDRLFGDGTVSELWTFFADPWHKKRHHKRRIVQAPFIALVAKVLTPGGLFRLATDWEPYAEEMLARLNAAPAFGNLAPDGGYAPRDESRTATRFERRGQRLGHGVWDLSFRRTP